MRNDEEAKKDGEEAFGVNESTLDEFKGCALFGVSWCACLWVCLSLTLVG